PVAVALGISLILALTWTPALSHLLVRTGRASAPDEVATAGIMGRLARLYERAMKIALAYPASLAVFCVVLIAVSFLCYRALGSDLLPSMDEGGFVLDYLMPAGASLADTNRVLIGVENLLHS